MKSEIIKDKFTKYLRTRIFKICALFFVLSLFLIPVILSVNNINGHDGDSIKTGQIIDLEIEETITNDDYNYNEELIILTLSEEELMSDISDTSDITENTITTESEKLNGFYTKTYYNGDIYSGDFVDGIRSGQGTYTWANGIIYAGEFIDGNPTENGEYIYPAETKITTEEETETNTPNNDIIPATELPSQPDPTRNIEEPDKNFMQIMFDNAIEIPGSENIIEPPPDGRSLELQYGAVPLNKTIPEPFEYFKNIVFLGDSVTIGFDIYRNKVKFNGQNVLRDVNVVAVGSYGVYNATRDISESSIHPLFGGTQTLPQDIIAQKDAQYVFICLGLNDVAIITLDDYIACYSYLIDRIREKSPEKTIVIMSVTPIVFDGQKRVLNNNRITEANNLLLKFAKENNLAFIDYAAAIRDSQNCLYDELSTDAFCHLTIEAYDRIIEYLLYHPLT